MIFKARTFVLAAYATAAVFTAVGVYLIAVGLKIGALILAVGCGGWWASGFASGVASVVLKMREGNRA